MNKKFLIYVGLLCEVVVFVAIFSGCVKDQSGKQEFGAEVSENDVNGSLTDVYSQKPDPYYIGLGELVKKDSYTNIETFPSILFLQASHEVTEVTPIGPNLTIAVHNTMNELINNKMVFSENQTVETIEKPANVVTAGLTSEVLQKFQTRSRNYLIEALKKKSIPVPLELLQPYASTDSGRMTYHNLEKKHGRMLAPASVLKRSDCGGLTIDQCQNGIPVTQVSFDVVQWEGTIGHKTSVLLIASQHVPYFSTEIARCLEAVQTAENQIYKIRQCTQVTDFTKGTSSASTPAAALGIN